MSSTNDNHGPRAGCNWNQCGLDEPDTCPFVKDEIGMKHTKLPVDVEHMRSLAKPTCKHEWHQVSSDLDHRVYCIHCLKIEKLAIP